MMALAFVVLLLLALWLAVKLGGVKTRRPDQGRTLRRTKSRNEAETSAESGIWPDSSDDVTSGDGFAGGGGSFGGGGASGSWGDAGGDSGGSGGDGGGGGGD